MIKDGCKVRWLLPELTQAFQQLVTKFLPIPRATRHQYKERAEAWEATVQYREPNLMPNVLPPDIVRSPVDPVRCNNGVVQIHRPRTQTLRLLQCLLHPCIGGVCKCSRRARHHRRGLERSLAASSPVRPSDDGPLGLRHGFRSCSSHRCIFSIGDGEE